MFLYDCFIYAKKQENELSQIIWETNGDEWMDAVQSRNQIVAVRNDLRRQIIDECLESGNIDFLLIHRNDLGIEWRAFCPVNHGPVISSDYWEEIDDDGNPHLFYGDYAVADEGFICWADGIRLY